MELMEFAPVSEDADALRVLYNHLRDVEGSMHKVQGTIAHIVLTLGISSRNVSTDESVWEQESRQQPEFPGQQDTDGCCITARDSGVHASDVAALKQELENQRSLKQGLQSAHVLLRHYIDKISRHWVRPLHVLDMPHEILVNIFELVEDFWPEDPWLYTKKNDIKNIRLTCRSFCNAASHLLLRAVRVDPRFSSLTRLEEIARHPYIRKGVYAVRVVLHFYDSFLADNISDYISYHAVQLEQNLNLCEEAKLWEITGITEEMCVSVVKHIRETLDSWGRLASELPGDSLSEKDRAHQELLGIAHREYRRLFKEQELGIGHGKFTQTVATAMASMPCARRLEFHDSDFEALGRRSLMSQDVSDAIYRNMLLPISGYNILEQGLGQPPYEILAELLAALPDAGVVLNTININLPRLEDPAKLVPDPEVRQRLSSAVRQLRQFSIKIPEGFGLSSDHSGIDLSNVLGPYVNTTELKSLRLSADARYIGRLITLRPWPNLSQIILSNASLHQAELTLLIRRLERPPKIFALCHIHLLDGTWVQVLDDMREKCGQFMTISNPRGAECDEMLDEEYFKVFGRVKSSRYSEADLYVCGLRQDNPLSSPD